MPTFFYFFAFRFLPYLQSHPKRENTRSQIQSVTRPNHTKGPLFTHPGYVQWQKQSVPASLRVKHPPLPKTWPKKFSK